MNQAPIAEAPYAISARGATIRALDGLGWSTGREIVPPHELSWTEVFPSGGYPIASDRIRLEQDVPAHSHDFCEIAVIASGSVRHVTARTDRVLVEGDVVSVRPGGWHEYRGKGGVEVCNLYVGPQLLTSDLRGLLGFRTLTGLLLGTSEPTVHLERSALGRVVGWLAQLGKSAPHPGPVGALQLCSLLGCVLAEFATEDDNDPDADTVLGEEVRGAIAAMVAEPARPWRVFELAGLVAVSSSYLQHRFAQQLGTSPLRWLARHRAEQMALRLIGSNQTVSAIGSTVGWVDPNYASRRFRQEFGMTPSQYRSRFQLGRVGGAPRDARSRAAQAGSFVR